MHLIRAYFSRFLPLTDEEWTDFEQCLTRETYPRKTIVLEVGQVCDYIAFIEQGTFRFYIDVEGEEKITAFFFSGEFVSNYRSVITGQPSAHRIEAMQDAVVHKIRKKDLEQLYAKHHSLERLGRLIAEGLFLSVTRRLDSLLYASPQQRYQELLKRNSRLLQDVPQYMLASYLGVKPETLSRIRGRK